MLKVVLATGVFGLFLPVVCAGLMSTNDNPELPAEDQSISAGK